MWPVWVMEYFQKKGVTSLYPGQELLNMEWFTRSMEEKRPVLCTDSLRLKPSQASVSVATEDIPVRMPSYECQRITALKHHNHRFTTALELLEEHAGYQGGGQRADSRARGFRRASCTLKSLSHPLTSIEQAGKLPNIGPHSLAVIKDILEDGYSQEVQDICDGDFYNTMQLFTGIFGIGCSTARKWYEKGFRTLDDIRNDSTITLRKDQKIGLELYQDLNTPVTLAEANIIQELVKAEVQRLQPGATVVLTGGFRRGKTEGHDVDLLISHPTEGKETGLLSAVLARLRRKNLLAYESTTANTYDPSTVTKKEYTLDHFERCFSIFKFDKSWISSKPTSQSPPGVVKPGTSNPDLPHQGDRVSLGTAGGSDGESTAEKAWVGRRVDLIIAPASQYAYALVGWTGSKYFNRSARLYAEREMNMKLTSHVLYDPVKNQYLSASSEEDVFRHLQLPYREPTERNC
ncbi:PREDICTED: DNA-directed DNA/RNA polymerase mu-like isoform X2 [Branchiostoma belcheri]|uniref:DNA-directed DNA/RNA polymerase mu-like isoform X2 n=1 Tax=Branchiostoma belcheri TaxID=7741 RepID=A0A6P4Z2L8_BRABE|nr:PREDICTED: DNA-directed DNA/RNA polymerase mu-like isoform X2 [Branchiostoma belcheri]